METNVVREETRTEMEITDNTRETIEVKLSNGVATELKRRGSIYPLTASDLIRMAAGDPEWYTFILNSIQKYSKKPDLTDAVEEALKRAADACEDTANCPFSIAVERIEQAFGTLRKELNAPSVEG